LPGAAPLVPMLNVEFSEPPVVAETGFRLKLGLACAGSPVCPVPLMVLSVTWQLELLPLNVAETVKLAGRDFPLAGDFSTSVAMFLVREQPQKLGFARLVHPDRSDRG